MEKSLLKYIFGAALLTLVWSCQKDEISPGEKISLSQYDATIPLEWNELFLDMERYTEGYRPPVSARAMAYTNLAAYEAVSPAMTRYQSVINQMSTTSLPELDDDAVYHWPLVMTSAYNRIMTLFFDSAPTEQLYQLDVLATRLENEHSEGLHPFNKQKSIERGVAVADRIFAWSATDQIGHESHTRNTVDSYVPPSGPGLWQPTYPDFLDALTPYWGEVRTFAASRDIKAKNPLPYDESPTSQLYAQALETQVIVNEVKNGNRYEDHWIAEFWSDDCPILTFTPAGRWISITNQSVKGSQLNLEEAVALYAQVSLALSDAGVRCWDEKFRFNYLRPIEYIHKVMGDDQWNTVMCPDGSGRFFTPNFPTYPSGHATFAGAAATILSEILGNNYAMTDRCHEHRHEFKGKPRSFHSFQEMAEESSYSRVPLGVHFRMDSEAGLDLGRNVGREVLKLGWK